MSRKNARPAAKKAAAKRKAAMEGKENPRRVATIGHVSSSKSGLAMALVGAQMVERMKKSTQETET